MVDSSLAFDVFARDDGASAVFEKVARAADKTGTALKKTSKISDDVAKASANLTKAHNAESDALDKVQVAEARLADVRGNSKAKTGQVIAAEKALAKARREAAMSGEVALKAAKELGSALDNEAKKSGKGVLGALKKSFDLGGGSIFKQVGENAGNGILGGITGALKTPVIGPALIAGVGGALAVALPEVGAIAGAGIVAGFGLGLIGLGSVFAAKTVAVKNAWNRTMWSMAADMKVLSQPFTATLVSMAGVAKRTFATFKPELAGAFKTLAPAATDFGNQLGLAFAKLAPAVQPLSQAAAAVLKAFGPAMVSAIGNVSQALQDLSTSVEKNPKGLADLTTGLGDVIAKTLDTVRVLNDLNGLLRKIPGGFGNLSKISNLLNPVGGAFKNIGSLLSDVTRQFDGTASSASKASSAIGLTGTAASYYTQGLNSAQVAAVLAGKSLDQVGSSAGRSAAQTHAANAAAYLLATAYDRQAAATQKANQSLMQMSGLLLTLSGSEIAYQQAVDDVTASIKANGATHDITTQKGRDNQTALDQSAAAANAQTVNLRNSNKASVAVAIEAQREYAKQAVQMHYTAAEAHAMALEFIKIPKKTKADFKVDITDLTAKVATARKTLKDPNLSATKKAKLQADIVQWQAGIAAAKRSLAGLPVDKKAKLVADKADLDAKLAAAKKQLADPKLTATKRAKLEATYANLLAAVRAAQAKINSLQGKTVVNHVVTAYTTTGSRSSGSGVGGGHIAPNTPGRAVGGPVKAGQPYMVGEKGPELWTPKADGTIIPNNALKTGQSVASGLAQGMLGGGGSAISAAGQVAAQMIAKAKSVLGIASPSKAFAQLGLYINQGFKIGLLGSSKQVQSVMSSLMSKVLNIAFNAADTKKAIQKTIASYNTAIAAARKKIKPVTSGMSKSEAAKTERSNAAAAASIKALRAKLAGAKVDLANVQAIASRLGTTVKRNAVLGMLQRENVAMQKLANARAVVANQLKAAQTKLANAIQVRNDFKQQITDAALSFNAITNLQPDSGGSLTASDILARMQQTLAQTRNFASSLATLKAQGLRSDLYKQLADAGVEAGGATAAALLAGGKGAIASANSLQAQIANASAGLGNTAAKNMYQAGVDAAQGLVNGLLAKTKALDAASKKLAAAIVAQIKKTLGIHSPSKVMEWHGSMAAVGFAKGIEGEYGRAMKASAGLGQAAIPASQSRRSAVPTQSAGGGVMRIEIAAGDSSPYTDFLVRELRKYVKIRGGNVQQALG